MPSGPRVFGIKFALSATLVCLSWLLLQATPMESDAWWFALGGHLVALVTVPTWFLLARSEAATLGLAVLVPYFLLLPVGYFSRALVLPMAALYGMVVLGLVPWATRRGVASGLPSWLSSTSFGGPRRLLIREQRDAMWMTLIGLIAGGVLSFEGSTEGAALMIFVFCAVSAVLSASLAFAEARRQGTLEVELAAWARRRVLVQRAMGSLFVTVLLAIVTPLTCIAIVDKLTPAIALAWTLMMLVTWCVALAASVHVASAGAGVVAGLGAMVLLFFAQVWGFGGAFLFTARTLRMGSSAMTEVLLPLSLLVLGGTALFVAAQRFLRADRLQPRVLVSATLGSVATSVMFGALAAVGP
jgi:hypothetical protein